MSRDIDKRMNGSPSDGKETKASTWRPRPKDRDIISNNEEGAPPVPVGQPQDRENSNK